MVRTFATVSVVAHFLACLSSPPRGASRASLADLLARATGRHVRVEREEEHWIAYTDDALLAPADRAGGERRARAIFDAACTALELDPALLGPIEWAEHPKPTACSSELWPGTREPTTYALCV